MNREWRIVKGRTALALLATLALAPGGAAAATNITARVAVSRTNEWTALDPSAGQRESRALIGLRNRSAEPVATSAWVLVSLSRPDIAVPGASGLWAPPGGAPQPYFALSALVGPAGLGPDAALELPLRFIAPLHERFTYAVELYDRSPDTPPEENAPPAIVSTPLTNAVEGHIYFYDLEALDPDLDPVVFVADTAPTGMWFSSDTGLLRWTPARHQAGSHTVSVRALDPHGAAATQAFTIAVAQFNEAPVITTLPVTVVEAGAPYVYDVEAYDPEGEPVTFALVRGPPDLSLDPASGRMAWTPAADATGTHAVAVAAADPAGAAREQAFELTVYPAALALQLLAPAGATSILVNTTLTLQARANHEAARIRAEILPDNAGFDGRVFTFTPTNGQQGRYLIPFTAQLDDQAAQNLYTIDVLASNTPPVLVPPGDRSVNEGAPLTISLSAWDADGDALAYSAPGLAISNAWFDALRREFRFNPADDQAGDYTVVFRVSDGQATDEAAARIRVVDVPVTNVPLELVLDAPETPTLKNYQTISGSVRGQAAPPPPPRPPALIVGFAPDAIRQGQSNLVVEVRGLNTGFATNATVFDWGADIAVQSVEVLSPTLARVTLRAAPLAALGPRSVSVAFPGDDAYSVTAFNVEQGRATIRGRVVDLFSGAALSNALVTLYGTLYSARADADGWFELQAPAAGACRLLIAPPNYQTVALDIAVGRNETLTLAEPIGARALTQPAGSGGSLPRAATLASLLDRGLSLDQTSLGEAQCRDLVQDMWLTVGGSLIGVLDENGNQLNPQVAGTGAISFTPEGIRRQAKALAMGRTYTLEEFHWALTEAFDWSTVPLPLEALIVALQEEVDEAWQNPQLPDSALPIALFNEGRTLSAMPPRLTKDTRLNAAQTSMLFWSFLLARPVAMENSFTRVLDEHGIDYRAAAAEAGLDIDWRDPPSPSPINPARRAVLTAAGVPVPLQGGVTVQDPNAYDPFRRYAGQNVTRVWQRVMGGALVEAKCAAIGGLFVTFATQTCIGMAMGATGGATGALLGGLVAAAASIQGFYETLMIKMLTAWLVGHLTAAMDPMPPMPLESALDNHSNLVINFQRSESEVRLRGLQTNVAMNAKVNFTYLLYGFDAIGTDTNTAHWRVPARLVPDLSDPHNYGTNYPTGRLQFIVALRHLREGMNYLRIATVQFIRNADQDLLSNIANYDLDGDGLLSPDEFSGPRAKFDEMDTKDPKGKLDRDEFVVQNVNSFQDFGLDKTISDEYPDAGQGYPPESNLLPYGQLPYTPSEYFQLVEESRERLDVRLNNVTAAEGQPRYRYLNQLAQESHGAQYDADIALENARAGFVANNRKRIQGTVDSLKYLQTGGSMWDGNPLSEESHLREIAGRLGLASADDMTPEMKQAFRVYAARNIEADRAKLRVDIGETSVSLLETTTQEKVRALPVGETMTVEWHSMAPDGTVSRHAIVVPGGEEGARLVRGVANDLRAKIPDLKSAFSQACEVRGKALNGIWHETVPALADYRKAKVRHVVDIQEANRKRDVLSKSFESEVADIKSKSRGPVGASYLALAEDKRAWKKAIVGDPPLHSTDTLSGMQMGSEMMVTAVNSIKVLMSEWSSLHIFRKSPQGVQRLEYPPAIEPSPDPFQPGAVFRTVRSNDVPKDGWIRLEYPLEADQPNETTAQFPPGLLATDQSGRFYAVNMNSTLNYGGRIFRFVLRRTRPLWLDRDYVGNVNYFSLSIMYGRPAQPVAMCAGPPYGMPGIPPAVVRVQDLYVANLDLVDNVKRVLRVPVGLVDARPDVYGPTQDRSHIVGQLYVESPDFDFTGPCDMELGPDPSSAVPLTTPSSAVFLSDRTTIFAMNTPAGSATPTLRKLISIPGRNWSGLAFDKIGNFYFADYASGAIYMLPWTNVQARLQSGAPIDSHAALGALAYQIGEGFTGVGDIEVEPPSEFTQRALQVSTPDGVDRLPLPIVGRLSEAGLSRVAEMASQRAGHEFVWKRCPLDPALFYIPTDFEQAQTREADIRIRRRLDSLQQADEIRRCVLTAYGPTILNHVE